MTAQPCRGENPDHDQRRLQELRHRDSDGRLRRQAKEPKPRVCEEEPQGKAKNRCEIGKDNRPKAAQWIPAACETLQDAEDDKESTSCGVVGPTRQTGHKCHGEREDEETTDGQECEQSEFHGALH